MKAREGHVCPSSLKSAPTGRALPWPPQKDIVHLTSHPPPRSLVFTVSVFKPTAWILESYRGFGMS